MSGSVGSVDSKNNYNSANSNPGNEFSDAVNKQADLNGMQSTQSAPTQFSNLMDFNNMITSAGTGTYLHTPAGGGADKGGTDTYNKTDGNAVYTVTNNGNNTTTLVSKVNTVNENGSFVETRTTTFGADGNRISSSAVSTSGTLASQGNAQLMATQAADAATQAYGQVNAAVAAVSGG